MAGVEVSLILLAAPAAAAGAVCLDRVRGTLTHVLVTDLSDSEVVLGKLGSRLLPVFGLVAASIPVLALVGLLGGVIPEAVVTLFVVTLGLAVLGCVTALTVSVRVLKAHEVLMAGTPSSGSFCWLPLLGRLAGPRRPPGSAGRPPGSPS